MQACYTKKAKVSATPHRELETNTALKQFARTRGNGYIRMQFAATLHEVYGYIVGFIVFVGTLKFIKLLRFNKRMGEYSPDMYIWNAFYYELIIYIGDSKCATLSFLLRFSKFTQVFNYKQAFQFAKLCYDFLR